MAQGMSDAEARAAAVDLLRALVTDSERPLTGISVAWLNGESSISRAWAGWRSISAEHPVGSLPIEANTLFRVASVSKLAQTLAALRLHDAKVLDLDSDISGLLRAPVRHPRFLQIPITPRMLLTHRSGLLDHLALPLPSGEALRRALADSSNWGPETPGQRFRYGNLGMVLLATVMEAAARQPFDALMQRWLFDPLGITARYSPATLSPTQRGQLATLYRRPDGATRWLPQIDIPGEGPHAYATDAALGTVGENASVHSPHGGLRISVPDLARLARFIMLQGRWEGRRLLTADTYLQMVSPQSIVGASSPGDTTGGLFRSWGLGLQHFSDVFDAQGGDRLHPNGGVRGFGQLGSAYGLLSGLIVVPATGTQPARGLVYVINGTSQGAIDSPGQHSSLRRSEERVIESLLDILASSKDTR